MVITRDAHAQPPRWGELASIRPSRRPACSTRGVHDPTCTERGVAAGRAGQWWTRPLRGLRRADAGAAEPRVHNRDRSPSPRVSQRALTFSSAHRSRHIFRIFSAASPCPPWQVALIRHHLRPAGAPAAAFRFASSSARRSSSSSDGIFRRASTALSRAMAQWVQWVPPCGERVRRGRPQHSAHHEGFPNAPRNSRQRSLRAVVSRRERKAECGAAGPPGSRLRRGA